MDARDDDDHSVMSEMTANTANTANTAMSAKDELTAHVRRWIRADQELAQAKKVAAQAKEKKQAATQALMETMRTHGIECLDMNGGSLVYKRRKVKRPISGKYLSAQLAAFYADQPDMAREVARHLLSHRAEVVKEDIAREVKA
jgi:hypothetical protein